MEREPRKLPNYAAEIHTFKWYCFHCPNWRNDANSMLVHLAASHDINAATRGEDYDDGSFVRLAQLHRGVWERKQPGKFARALDSLRGAEDFAFEVGKGAPIKKWSES